MGKATVFMDESGNTGSNLLDPEQQIFTFVGIGIDNDEMVPILIELEKIKIKYGIPPNHRIHAKNLRPHRRALLTREIFDLLMKHHFIFFLSLVEKKFTIATYVDNDFYDPVYNDLCDNSWTYPHDKNERANFFYDHLSEEAMIACGKAFSTGQNMRETYELVRNSIEGKNYKLDLFSILEGAKPHLEDLGNAIISINDGNESLNLAKGVAQSPNFFSFCGLLNKIENYYSKTGSSAELVFDSSRQFNISFLEFFKKLRDAEKTIFQFGERLPQILGYQSIHYFMYEKSQNSVFLQLADLIATSVKDVIQKIYWDTGDEHYSEFESFILFFIHEGWQRFDDQFFDFIMSTSLTKKMVTTLYDENRMEVLRR